VTRSEVAVGVVGTGRIGRIHAELVARRLPGARLAAVCDADPRLAERAARELGAEVAGSAAELIAGELDAVVICSSTDTHPQLIEAAVAAGLPVLCEKPLTLSLAEARRLRQLGRDSGALIQVGFNRRFDPAHARVRAAVSDGTLGDVHMIRISSRDPAPPPLAYARVSGGLFLDMACHDFDMARFISGSEVDEVFVRGARRVDPDVLPADDVDTAVAVLSHRDGCMTTIDNSRGASYGYDQRVEAFGSRAMASSGNELETTAVLYGPDGVHAAPLRPFILERYEASYLRELEAFVDAVVVGAPAPVTARDAEAALAIGLAARTSLHEGRPVAVAEAAR
jgi:myo-inositol 2-dehydrogenase / D-chiro-inositol 1-dehydrogenase